MEVLASKVLATLVLFGTLFGHSATQEESFYECMFGMPSVGVTIPRADIEREVGSQPFPLYCHLNPNHETYKTEGYTSADLKFYIKPLKNSEALQPWQPIESQRINETTIKAIYDPTVATRDRIDCRIIKRDGAEKSICPQTVYVGYEPENPENFKCISENWENLICSWDVPYNPIKTEYNLYFYERGHGRKFSCPRYQDKPNTCYIRKDPTYRKHWDKYYFNMEANNSLGLNSRFISIIDHYQVVRPKPPQNLQLIDIKPRQLVLKYEIDVHLHLFPPGFRTRIQMKSQYDSTWTELPYGYIDTANDEDTVNTLFNNLYPYTTYTIRIGMQSNDSNINSEDLWSDFVEIIGRTSGDVPQMPPKTTQGSFEVVTHHIEKRNVYVYWRQIEEFHRNGPNFRYIITEVLEDGLQRPIVPGNVTAAYALFENLRAQSSYTFFVTSENENGTAHQTARLDVPSADKMRGLQPQAFTKIAYSDRLYELSWLPPKNEEKIVSYTVFWCKSLNNRDRPYQCEGQLDWAVVPKTNLSLNVSLPDTSVYQFAVSANTQTASSGMVWSTCTILLDRVVGKLKTVTVDLVKERAMKVSWKLDCTDRIGSVTGYKIEYCKIRNQNDHECLGKWFVQETTEDYVTITNLEPFTYYKVAVRVVSKAGESELSDYHVNRTARARPENPPRSLQISDPASNSLKLSWEPPLITNGPIDLYEVQYCYHENGQSHCGNTVKTPNQDVRLRDLTYFAPYELKVRACAQLPEHMEPSCGDWSSTTHSTGIGKSKRMPAPVVTFENSTKVKIQWDPKSFHHGGPIQRYEVRVLSETTNEEYIEEINGNSSYTILMLDQINQNLAPDCSMENVTFPYDFYIRSVTKDISQEYYSSWSPQERIYAPCPKPVPWVLIIVLCTSTVVIAFVVMVYFCKFYNYQIDIHDDFKEVSLAADAHIKVAVSAKPVTLATLNNGVYASPNDTKADWTEMQDMPSPHSGKKNGYGRSVSKDSIQSLIKRKTIDERGTSESTSGCDSGQNYESDEMDNNSARSASQGPNTASHENIPTGDTNRVAPMPYTQIGPNGWPQTASSEADQLTSEGYTRATQLFNEPIDANLENLRPPLPDRASYVAFQSFGRASPPSDASQGSSLTATPVAATPIITSAAPVSSGYISVDEANKFRAQTVEFVPSDPRAYSRVTIPPVQPQTASNSSMISPPDVAALSAKDLNPSDLHATSSGGQSRHTFV